MLQIFFCCGFWTLVLVIISWRLVKISRQAFNYLQRLHQIPCSNCAFFTGDYRLKCTVHPTTAMSEAAIACRDFTFKSHSQPQYECNSCAYAWQKNKTEKLNTYN